MSPTSSWLFLSLTTCVVASSLIDDRGSTGNAGDHVDQLESTDLVVKPEVGTVADHRERVVRRSASSDDELNNEDFDSRQVRTLEPMTSDRMKSIWEERVRNKNHRLALIQTQIMDKLRLTSKPNVTGRVPNMTESQIKDLYAHYLAANRHHDDEDDDDSADEQFELAGRPFKQIVHPNHHPSSIDRHRNHVDRSRLASKAKVVADEMKYTVQPTCNVPARLRASQFFSTLHQSRVLRLYFNVEAPMIEAREKIGERERIGKIHRTGRPGEGGAAAVQLETANLHLFWRGLHVRKYENHEGKDGTKKAGVASSENSSNSASLDTGSSLLDDQENNRKRTVRTAVWGLRGSPVLGRHLQRKLVENDESHAEIVVYQLSAGGGRSRIRHDETRWISKPLASVSLKQLAQSRGITLNISSAVEEWIKNPNKNYGLQIAVIRRLTSSSSSSKQRMRKLIDPLTVLDVYECADQQGRSSKGASTVEQEMKVNASKPRPRIRPSRADRYGFPYLKLGFVKRPRIEQKQKQSNRRRAVRRRTQRDVTSDVDLTSPTCVVRHFDVSFQNFSWGQTIVRPLTHRFTYCDTEKPCSNVKTGLDDKTSTAGYGEPGEECCESIEGDPLEITHSDHVTGRRTTFKLDESNVAECRLYRR